MKDDLKAKEIYQKHYMKNLGNKKGNIQDNCIIPAMVEFASLKSKPSDDLIKAIEKCDEWIKYWDRQKKLNPPLESYYDGKSTGINDVRLYLLSLQSQQPLKEDDKEKFEASIKNEWLRKGFNQVELKDEETAIQQNNRMREWFRERTGLDSILLSAQMNHIDKLLSKTSVEPLYNKQIKTRQVLGQMYNDWLVFNNRKDGNYSNTVFDFFEAIGYFGEPHVVDEQLKADFIDDKELLNKIYNSFPHTETDYISGANAKAMAVHFCNNKAFHSKPIPQSISDDSDNIMKEKDNYSIHNLFMKGADVWTEMNDWTMSIDAFKRVVKVLLESKSFNYGYNEQMLDDFKEENQQLKIELQKLQSSPNIKDK